MPYKDDIVTDEQLATAMFIYTKILGPTFQILSISANIINIVTFFKIGLKDSINITFLALSLSDLFSVLLDTSDNVCLNVAMSPWQQDIPISMHSISGVIHYYQHIFLDTSVCLETYLAIARCCCVSMPMRFKNVFTFKRSVAVILMLFVCNVVFRIPLLISYVLTWQTSPSTNLTKLTFYSTNDFKLFNSVEQIAGRTVFPVILFIIAITCSVILTSALINASLKRKLMTYAPSNHDDMNTKGIQPFDHLTLSSKTLKTKEVQLVKAVTLVTILLGVLLLILSVFSLAQAFVPDFFARMKYNNLHSVSAIVVSLVLTSHAGCKIFIYYTCNSRFQATIKAIIFGILMKDSPKKGVPEDVVGVPYIIVDVERHGLDAGAFERVKRDREGNVKAICCADEHYGNIPA
ncbi:hypothetical protein Btru_039627 [Bulinus truncatus]|nr:hypothetical protein Btru_039627 [Bulinus truncatus]